MRLYFYAFCIIALLAFSGCGSNSSSTDISVTLSSTSATVATSFTKQFTATVKNTSNTNVTWQVNSVTGGDSTHGTISTSGLYTAPTSVPSTPTVTITAISRADSNKTAQATVTIAEPISVSPSEVSVQVSNTYTFSASVTFATKTSVTWQVNGISGGNSTLGKIDSNGVYTAPDTVPSPNKVTITAVSDADSTRTDSATVTITPATIVISPTDAVISAGAQQAYTATLSSNTVSPVWSVTCPSTAAGACGTISSGGTYTAPSAPPPQSKVTITASMPDGTATTTSVTATIQFGNASLAGTYIFTLADEVGHLAPSQAGALVFDGSGNISGGSIDSTGTPGTPIAVTGGTYSVGTDGRGTASVQTASGTLGLQFVLASHTLGFLVRTDTSANQSAGTIELQQPGAASALNGSYTLAVSGWTAGASASLQAEAGSIRVGSTGAISGGILDTNKDAALQTANVTSGYVTQPSNGYRGTLAIATANGTQAFAYYPVDSKHAKLVQIDGASGGLGELFQQSQDTYSISSLKGRYVFSARGAKAGALYGVAGVFSLDGTGTARDVTFDGIPQTVFDYSPGVYTVTDAQTGRTTATWSGNGGSQLQYVLYPRSDGGFAVLQCDGAYLGTGEALLQDSTRPYTYPIPKSAFALSLGGSELSTASSGERITAHLSFSTITLLSGTADGTSLGQASEFAFNVLDQNLSPERYTLGISSTKMTGGPVIMYRVNDDKAFLIEADSTRVLTGVLQRQY